MANYRVGIFFLGFFLLINAKILSMQDRQELVHAQSGCWKVKALYSICVAGVAFTGQYLTIKNYYDDNPHSDDLTGVYSGGAVALGIGLSGVLAYVGGKYLMNCRNNFRANRSSSRFEDDENREL